MINLLSTFFALATLVNMSTFFSLTNFNLRSLSLQKAIIFGKMLIFFSTHGPSGSPQLVRFVLFLSFQN